MATNADDQGYNLDAIADQYGIKLQFHEGQFNPTRLRTLIYGASGSGKTRLAATWPDAVFLNLDDGLASVDWVVGDIPIHSKDELDNALTFLSGGNHPFRTVVLDSLRELQALLLQDVKTRYPNIRRPYDDLASQSDYGKILADFDDYMRKIKALPYNTVYITDAFFPDSDEEQIKPSLVGKATAAQVCLMMDVVGYLYATETTDGERGRAMTFYSARHITKDRSGRLPSYLVNPTFDGMRSFWES